jgi:RNA polymerase sigma-70 factor, ECF subfamily
MIAMAYPKTWTGNDESDSDLALVERALDNDLAAFEQLVSRYQNKIMAYVARMLNDHEEAEDVTQEVFIKAYRSLDSFRGASSFSTWLYRIATNLCIDRVRKRKRSPQQAYSLDEPFDKDEDSGGRDVPNITNEPSLGVEREELRQQVRLTVAQMPEKLRSVLVMCDIQGMAYEQIAQVLDCPVGTVKSRLFHARADLARRLRPYMHGVK